MKSLMALTLAMLMPPLVAHAAGSAAGASVAQHWLFMVKTRNTDPSREADFNRWYDTVDIPDVLKVPGYLRARRARELNVAPVPLSGAGADRGPYVALYDMRSDDIDKTIIDMLMASWQMEKEGHSTPLLKVTERVYYHQYAPIYEGRRSAAHGKHSYLFLARYDRADGSSLDDFDRWYNDTFMPAVMQTSGFVRATRYRLYRVLMVKPVTVPQFLTVFEIRADSAARAMKNLQKSVDDLAGAGKMGGLYEAGDSALYHLLKDVRRSP